MTLVKINRREEFIVSIGKKRIFYDEIEFYHVLLN